MYILSYSCFKLHEQNNKVNYYLHNPDSMSEFICIFIHSNVSCIVNSEARELTNLIQ